MIARFNNNYVPAYWDDFFNDNFFKQVRNTGSEVNRPAVNVSESDKDFTIEVAAPGVSREDFKLEVDNDILTISTEQKEGNEEQKQNYLRREFSFRSFKRNFQLPESVDQGEINATHEAGILKLILPKKEEVVQNTHRQIEVK